MDARELVQSETIRVSTEDGKVNVTIRDQLDQSMKTITFSAEHVSALREAFAKLNNNGNPEGTGFPGVPGAAVGDFCMAMMGIGLAAFDLLRGGAGLGLTPAQQKDPGVQANLRQLDSCTSTAEAALRGGSRLVIPR